MIKQAINRLISFQSKLEDLLHLEHLNTDLYCKLISYDAFNILTFSKSYQPKAARLFHQCS